MPRTNILLYEQPPSRFRIGLACGLVVIAYGIAGSFDYADARREECAAKQLDYNSREDKCIPPPPPVRAPNPHSYKDMHHAPSKAR